MAEKTFLTVDLYDNVLTEKSNDYTGKVSITGTIHNTDIADRIVKARTPGRGLLKLLKQLTANFRVATTGPVVNDFTDSASKLVNQQITPNSPAIITGSNLLIKGDNPSVGSYFTPDGADKTPVKVALVVTNTTSQIIIQVPALPDGQYLLSVTTQAGAGYSLVKEPRTYQFPILLTVGNQPGGGGDRPEIE